MPAAEARRIARKFEFHCTPKHASSLNTAEPEVAVLTPQRHGHRLSTQALLASEIAAWEYARNAPRPGVTWRFTPADAQKKPA